MRGYEKKLDLKEDGLVTNRYYTNFPDNIKIMFPMCGNTGNTNKDDNSLVIDRQRTVYLIRQESWSLVSLDGWTEIGRAEYLGVNNGEAIMYEKTFGSGTFEIDNQYGYYLFPRGKCITFFIL